MNEINKSKVKKNRLKSFHNCLAQNERFNNIKNKIIEKHDESCRNLTK